MADKWITYPPWTEEQGPTNISLGSLIREDFEIVKHTSEFEILTSFHWVGLSRQEVANLRNLTSSKGLRELLRSYGYGISWGAEVETLVEKDPNDAVFDLMIDSKETIPYTSMSEIVNFVKCYRVE
jgi:hypothetical protein